MSVGKLTTDERQQLQSGSGAPRPHGSTTEVPSSRLERRGARADNV